ncbi:hypothetical protein G6F35_014772 [Rhizopus arrhizus]|nr:hypothetical protein G6F35_014772 [Rhizopus arrhizus]
MLPFTRFLVGTTLGTWAAIVPLSANLVPFFARIAQVSLNDVDHGLVEAARAMGCRRWHIVRHVLLPEALPGIIGGMTVSVIAMINASAMAGAVGAGGLGDLAIRYGYERYETRVMFEVIVILIALVSIVQFTGEWLSRRADHKRAAPRGCWPIADFPVVPVRRKSCRSPPCAGGTGSGRRRGRTAVRRGPRTSAGGCRPAT